jgi:glutamate-1-semialdehyde 2,1-aminomutase
MLTSLIQRLQLSRAKHPSLHGHARLSKRFARLVPYYEYGPERFFASDGAPFEVAERRRAGFARLGHTLSTRAPRTLEATESTAANVSDLQFTNAYRVPFQYRRLVREQIKLGAFLESSDGVVVRDLDGNAAYDLSGSYGVNVFGHEFYKACIAAGATRAQALGPVLGAYHPVVADNVARLRRISGLDEISFHMSGTEAVMQAVRLARYHTGRSHLVQFTGAYHGWWDGVQAGVGNPRPPREVYTLNEMDERTLTVLRSRRDLACVLVNPLQALHPNASAPGDATLLASDRRAGFDREAYARWLRTLREICTARGIPLIFDEVFVGFRLALGGAQEYFGVRADLVTYGKTVAGGLPIGVVCGTRDLMRRFRDDRPSDICFARGTFNSHPYVMTTMNEFLQRLDDPAIQAACATVHETWRARIGALNTELAAAGLPVHVGTLASIATICYTAPSRYNWMFQFYLRAAGLHLSWVGSGRLVFSHDYRDEDFAEVARRIVSAARAMQEDGWWWHQPSLTNTAIRRQVLREMLAARLRGLA